MSTNNPAARREQINAHRGGIFYELAGHMLDQVIWILGKPNKTACFLRTDDYGTGERVEGFADNTLGVFEFDRAIATVEIAAMETQPTARRYEVYGTAGSAIIVEPFEPGSRIRLCLAEATEEYAGRCADDHFPEPLTPGTLRPGTEGFPPHHRRPTRAGPVA